MSIEDGVSVVFHKVDSHDDTNSGDESGDDERTAARIHLQSNCHVSCDYDDDAEGARGSDNSLEGSEKKTLCPPAFCVRSRLASRDGSAHEGRREHALS